MNEETGVHYLKPWALNETVTGLGGLGRIVQSNHVHWKEGEIVQGVLFWPWKKFFVVNCEEMKETFEKVYLMRQNIIDCLVIRIEVVALFLG